MAEIHGAGDWGAVGPSPGGSPPVWRRPEGPGYAARARALGRGGRRQGGQGQMAAEARSEGIRHPTVSAASDDQKSLKEGVQ